MGTVEFDAKPGVITDLGTIVTADDDKPTPIPELSNHVFGKLMGDALSPVDAAIRQATPADVPDSLKSLPHVEADYRAVAPFPNFLGAPLLRLAPLAGVLAYDKAGHVIDTKSGQVLGN
jgi:hypothetical protein